MGLGDVIMIDSFSMQQFPRVFIRQRKRRMLKTSCSIVILPKIQHIFILTVDS